MPPNKDVTPGQPNPPGSLPVSELARRCAAEMARYRRGKKHNPRCCFELFRRAIAHRDQEAWGAIYEQYHFLVERWLRSAPGDPDLLVNQAFERFWKAVSPDRFDGFPTLDRLLGYLRRCAQCVAIDASRRHEREQVREAALEQMHTAAAEERSGPPEAWVLDGVVGEQFYRLVLECLDGEQEHLLFCACFEWDLSPSEIVERWPETFDDARQVYRIKERILRRLRRNGELRQLLDDPDGGIGA